VCSLKEVNGRGGGGVDERAGRGRDRGLATEGSRGSESRGRPIRDDGKLGGIVRATGHCCARK
jgi:hypothetical protein